MVSFDFLMSFFVIQTVKMTIGMRMIRKISKNDNIGSILSFTVWCFGYSVSPEQKVQGDGASGTRHASGGLLLSYNKLIHNTL